jgi:hypothetical protein
LKRQIILIQKRSLFGYRQVSQAVVKEHLNNSLSLWERELRKATTPIFLPD